jgi:hypothetical protein
MYIPDTLVVAFGEALVHVRVAVGAAHGVVDLGTVAAVAVDTVEGKEKNKGAWYSIARHSRKLENHQKI